MRRVCAHRRAHLVHRRHRGILLDAVEVGRAHVALKLQAEIVAGLVPAAQQRADVTDVAAARREVSACEQPVHEGGAGRVGLRDIGSVERDEVRDHLRVGQSVLHCAKTNHGKVRAHGHTWRQSPGEWRTAVSTPSSRSAMAKRLVTAVAAPRCDGVQVPATHSSAMPW